MQKYFVWDHYKDSLVNVALRHNIISNKVIEMAKQIQEVLKKAKN